ncbi:MAG: tRNA (adenosine(37)-N6)-threonylcarbamoyltransferase complex dimerization subunit type 1 TsaB, partial [Phycisphaerae bacterium]|nr:tRNA (adenosine(37)-N6)-threonylcarbamoyltransferase complex dimerization subunit type 1 TsaB [Phycisphaerae bacterium]
MRRTLAPRTLALETSGRTGSVAFAEGDRIISEQSFDYGLQNAARILPMIDEMCRAEAWSPADIQRIAISIGPGSFTGLRIGVTLAKTLAFATGAVLIPVPSIHVLAANAPADSNEIIIVLDAKRGQIFTARLRRQSDRWTEVEPAHLGTLAAILDRSPRPVHLIGEGIPYHRESIRDDTGIVLTDPSLWIGHASIVAKLADEFRAISDPAALIPLYIRKPEAEEKADLADHA